jgi:AcrR family transcriptional regulator
VGRTEAKRPRAAHLGPERRRPVLLEAAVHLFARHGYAGTSMDMIGDAAGVTKPVVYACFPGKRELFDALLEREEQRMFDQIRQALPAEVDPNDVEGALVGGLTAYFRAAAATPDSWRVIFHVEHGSDPAVVGRVLAARAYAARGVAQLAEGLLRQEGLGADAARRAALEGRVIVAAAEAGVRLMLEQPEAWTPEELGELLGCGLARAHAAFGDGG